MGHVGRGLLSNLSHGPQRTLAPGPRLSDPGGRSDEVIPNAVPAPRLRVGAELAVVGPSNR